jgi:beta-glucanase (GH16 family)
LLALFVVACGGASTKSPVSSSNNSMDAIAAWADEFDGPGGAFPDSSRWTYDLGNNGGWGNGELQQYTATRDNVRLDGQGHLVIRVESTGTGYTSARLKTQGLRAVQFGRLEARIKLPVGRGIWPAFWMLGSSFNGSNWPQCGEIDVMEFRGSEPTVVHGTVHGPQYSGGQGISASYSLPAGASFSDDFHTFAVQWEPGLIRFLVDGTVYHTVTPQQIPAGAPWVFDQRFFVLLNVAVGGNFVGPPDATTSFPQEMVVDYVRYSP